MLQEAKLLLETHSIMRVTARNVSTTQQS